MWWSVRRAQPRANGGTPATWTWSVEPGGGNWGLEYIRAPQMWNLNAAIVKASPAYPVTGVIDNGFHDLHPDLTFVQVINALGPAAHGTHVSGTIGARFDNGTGVDGVNPFARLIGVAPVFAHPNATAHDTSASSGAVMMQVVYAASNAGMRLINTSLGYNWHNYGIDASADLLAQTIASTQGAVMAGMLATLQASGADVPLLITAAGNESDIFTMIAARWASPLANAALEHNAPDILVVEAVSLPTGGDPAPRYYQSNTGGHLSAPGSAIVSTSHPLSYEPLSGTSMAAPHVTGVAGYLLALVPELTNAEIRQALLASTQLTDDGAAGALDAYAAALNIDSVRGNDSILRRLLDIDDGSADGNLRLAAGGEVVVDQDLDGDGGLGDGAIDMSDFRRWRDWLLQVEQAAGLSLDGAADHPKKDVNGDAVVQAAAQENIFPQGDFNGDGVLSRDARRWVAGAIGNYLTDLDVLQSRFSDAHHQPQELPDLIDSGDITINASACLAENPEAAYAVTRVQRPGTGETVAERTHQPGAIGPQSVIQICTVVTGQYQLVYRVYDSGGAEVGQDERDVNVQPGSDTHWEPACLPNEVDLVLAEWSLDTPLFAGRPASFVVELAHLVPGSEDLLPAAGVNVTLALTGGVASPASGVTDAEGRFTSTVVADPGVIELTILLEAEDDQGNTVSMERTDDVAEAALVHVSGYAAAHAEVGGNITNPSGSLGRRFFDEEDTRSQNSGPDQGGSASASTSGSGEYDWGTPSIQEPSLVFASASASASANHTTTIGLGTLDLDLQTEVQLNASLVNPPPANWDGYWYFFARAGGAGSLQSTFQVLGLPAQCTITISPGAMGHFYLTGGGVEVCWQDLAPCGDGGLSWTGELPAGVQYNVYAVISAWTSGRELVVGNSSGADARSGAINFESSGGITVNLVQ
jgi:hypothetical protein